MIEYNTEVFRSHEDKKDPDLDPVLEKSINKIIQNEGYLTYSIYVRDISTDGGNYLSVLKEIDIKGETANNKKETNLFIKICLPDSETNLLSPQLLLSKEIFIYTEFAELFYKLQEEFDVPDIEQYHFAKHHEDGNNIALILDNMCKKGFKIYNRFDITPFKATELAIIQLAKFHAFSVVLKEYRPDFYTNKIQTVRHPLPSDENSNKFALSLCEYSVSTQEEDRKRKLEPCLPKIINKLYGYINENDRKFKCLCHGDYRMNNILVKEENGEAASVIPIDYQINYYGSPVMDILYLIFLSTDRQLRKEQMENLKKTYFCSFTKFLRYFNIDGDTVYPQKDFEEDFKCQLDYGWMQTLLVLPFVLASEDDVPEINLDLKVVKLHDSFKKRLEEIIDDFVEWGYL